LKSRVDMEEVEVQVPTGPSFWRDSTTGVEVVYEHRGLMASPQGLSTSMVQGISRGFSESMSPLLSGEGRGDG
jgi:hypothetical protein